MKALYIPTALLAAILAFSLGAEGFIQGRSREWVELLDAADTMAQDENWAGAGARLRQVREGWDRTDAFFHTVLDHRELDEARSLLAGTTAACREQDNEDFHILLAQLKVHLQLMAETQAVSVKNIL